MLMIAKVLMIFFPCLNLNFKFTMIKIKNNNKVYIAG